MEHRLGTRHAIDLEVYLRTWGSTVSAKGRLKDLSVSGAFVTTQLPCQPMLHIAVQIVPISHSRRNCVPVEGLITRVAADGIGVEWDELQPELVARFLLRERSDEQVRMGTTHYMQ
jgi:hypothetical protein